MWRLNSPILRMIPQPSPLNPQPILSIMAFKYWLIPHGKRRKIVLKYQDFGQIIPDLIGFIRGKIKLEVKFHWQNLPTTRLGCDLSFFILNTSLIFFPINIVYFIVILCLFFFSLVIDIEVQIILLLSCGICSFVSIVGPFTAQLKHNKFRPTNFLVERYESNLIQVIQISRESFFALQFILSQI